MLYHVMVKGNLPNVMVYQIAWPRGAFTFGRNSIASKPAAHHSARISATRLRK
jgi:hypothetical protein